MATASDSFNRGSFANSTWITPFGNWITANTDQAYNLDNPATAYWDSAVTAFTSSHKSKVTWDLDFGVGVCCLASGTNSGNYNAYEAMIGPSLIEVYRVDNGTPTSLGSTSVSSAQGDNITLEAKQVGSTVELRVYKNDSLVTGLGTSGVITDSDANRKTSGQPGIAARFGTAGKVFDDWSAEDVAASSSNAPRAVHLMRMLANN